MMEHVTDDRSTSRRQECRQVSLQPVFGLRNEDMGVSMCPKSGVHQKLWFFTYIISVDTYVPKIFTKGDLQSARLVDPGG